MALNWNSIRAEHVSKACELVAADEKHRSRKAKGIVVLMGDKALPAKQVTKVAYLLANDLPLDTKLKFSSGQSTINRLQRLGFRVERSGQATSKEATNVPRKTSENAQY